MKKLLRLLAVAAYGHHFFANSLAKRAHTLHISTLCLYDIDSEKPVSSAVSQSTQLRRLPQIFR